MEQKLNSVSSAGTNDDSSTIVDESVAVRQHNTNAMLAAVLDYIKTEAKKLYDTRMNDDVDYDIVIVKVAAFEIVEKYIKKQLKNGR